MSYRFRGFGLLSSSRHQDPFLERSGLRFGSLLALKMAETSLGSPLGAAKSRSRVPFFRPWSPPRALQDGSRSAPRCLQEAERLQEASGEPFCTRLDPIWDQFWINFGAILELLSSRRQKRKQGRAQSKMQSRAKSVAECRAECRADCSATCRAEAEDNAE